MLLSWYPFELIQKAIRGNIVEEMWKTFGEPDRYLIPFSQEFPLPLDWSSYSKISIYLSVAIYSNQFKILTLLHLSTAFGSVGHSFLLELLSSIGFLDRTLLFFFFSLVGATSLVPPDILLFYIAALTPKTLILSVCCWIFVSPASLHCSGQGSVLKPLLFPLELHILGEFILSPGLNNIYTLLTSKCISLDHPSPLNSRVSTWCLIGVSNLICRIQLLIPFLQICSCWGFAISAIPAKPLVSILTPLYLSHQQQLLWVLPLRQIESRQLWLFHCYHPCTSHHHLYPGLLKWLSNRCPYIFLVLKFIYMASREIH